MHERSHCRLGMQEPRANHREGRAQFAPHFRSGRELAADAACNHVPGELTRQAACIVVGRAIRGHASNHVGEMLRREPDAGELDVPGELIA